MIYNLLILITDIGWIIYRTAEQKKICTTVFYHIAFVILTWSFITHPHVNTSRSIQKQKFDYDVNQYQE
ncbi:hypothetical protein FCV43_09365 [Vibrio genomosp. F6]|uniref:hypothetical protein n=1 Tax=Vibrio sp. 03-59-1 TaxID=2607607 RepID=UPI001139EF56|nr:hypothetical protein [Vibrio sp. 03-59-1]NOH82416.1 hypothetical protein [Vibrio sp. 03-59-1]TKF21534.1 hypothetical protein FCV43_09365 [Vibrio genomosp. F6]